MKHIMIILVILIYIVKSYTSKASENDHRIEMFNRIGLAQPLDTKEVPFGVAVVDQNDVYRHSFIHDVEPIKDDCESLPEKLHGFQVCSVIHQLHPTLKIHYINYLDKTYDFDDLISAAFHAIDRALDNPHVKIINCSLYFPYSFPLHENRPIFEKAQRLGKFLLFGAGNHNGWFIDEFFQQLSQDENTKYSFAIVGASQYDGVQEAISFVKAGALRAHYLLAPGVRIVTASHTPTSNGVKFEDGTSLAVPHVVAGMAYLMADNLLLTPYDAWRQLCECANPPRNDLAHASIADQGWGYMNLGKALSNNKTNGFVCNPFTNLYDDYMRISTVPVSDEKYLPNLIQKLQNQDMQDVFIKQLYRSSHFSYGLLILWGRIEEASKYLRLAKEQGLSHEDPIFAMSEARATVNYMYKVVHKDPQNQTAHSLLFWYVGMIATAEYYQGGSCAPDLLKCAHLIGYEPANKFIGEYIFQTLVDAFISYDTKRVACLKNDLKDFYGFQFQSESEKKIASVLLNKYLSMFKECRELNISDYHLYDGIVNDLAELIMVFTGDSSNCIGPMLL